jgi:CTP:molybdopterin cytidylyltransferase MocA
LQSPASFFGQLIALGGDEGARKLLAAHEAELVKVPVGDPGVIRDIDRRRIWRRRSSSRLV